MIAKAKQLLAKGDDARALEQFAAALGIDGALRKYGVISNWDEVVGEQIARVARPQRIENGVL